MDRVPGQVSRGRSVVCRRWLLVHGRVDGYRSGQEQQQPKDDKKRAENKAAATTANEPKKVITNDDIKSSPFTGFGGVFYTNTGSINDCDTNCFEQVHMMAHVTGEKNATWRRHVLEQLDAVRSDSEWQTYLHELYDAH